MEQLEFIEKDGLLECMLSGNLSSDFCQKFEPELNEKIEAATGSVVFDLKHVSFLASAFLRNCLATLKKIGKDRFRIVNVQPEVKKVFIIAGFDGLVQ